MPKVTLVAGVHFPIVSRLTVVSDVPVPSCAFRYDALHLSLLVSP